MQKRKDTCIIYANLQSDIDSYQKYIFNGLSKTLQLLKSSTSRILILLLAWFCISLVVYTQSNDENLKIQEVSTSDEKMSKAGLLLYRKNKCMTCHSIFGLGGHLGPDLTNVYQRRDFMYIEYVLKSGKDKMPAQKLSKLEVEQILSYLEQVNGLGEYPVKSWFHFSFGRFKKI